MDVTRQHSETEITEVYGQTCQKFIVTRQKKHPDRVSLLYLRLDGVWHRFFLDAGLIHWQLGSPSQTDDAPFITEEQFDLGATWKFVGLVVEHIAFSEERLTVRFAGGHGFQVFTEAFDGESICRQIFPD